MSAHTKIAVLLSTYNGEKFLAEQLDSLLAQSHTNFILVVRDDGSKDRTVSILESYASDHSERIRLLSRDGENLGASAGFAFLVDYVLKNKDPLGLQSSLYDVLRSGRHMVSAENRETVGGNAGDASGQRLCITHTCS